MRWLGDEEDSITVTIVNDAAVPVDGIEIDLGNGSSFFPRFESKEFENMHGRLSIPAKSQMKLPVAGIRTLSKKLESMSICGVAIGDQGFERPARCGKAPLTHSLMMTVTLRYATIFGEEKTDHTRIHVYALPTAASPSSDH